MAEFLGTILKAVQMSNLNIHGYAVLPIHMRKIISSMGKVASRKGTMEVGFSVKPRLLKVVIPE